MAMFHSIRWRLVITYTLLTLLTVSLLGVLTLSLVERFIAEQEREYLAANAGAVARQAEPYVAPVWQQAQLTQLAKTSAMLGDAQVKILDARMRPVVDSGLPGELDRVGWILPAESDAGNNDDTSTLLFAIPRTTLRLSPIPGSPFVNVERVVSGADIIVVQRSPSLWGSRLEFHNNNGAIPLKPSGEAALETETTVVTEDNSTPLVVYSNQVVTVPIGDEAQPKGYVQLSNSPNLGLEALEAIQRAFLIAAVGVSLLAVMLGLVVSGNLTAPVKQLAQAATRMSSGDLSVRAAVQRQDEFGGLALQFNQMAGRLEQSFADLAAERDALRRFISDASHELRTPLTAMRTYNELLQGEAAADVAARQEFLTLSAEQLARLEWITTHLLDLSRLDAGLVSLELAEEDMGELLLAAAAPFRPVAVEQGKGLAVILPAFPVTLRCDRSRLLLALSNLLENGLKFGGEGCQVELGGRQQGEEGVIWVSDNGAGIPEQDLPHIFKRFYRGREQQLPGSGLGLAIVQSVVQAHGGKVAVESGDGRTTFTITFSGA